MHVFEGNIIHLPVVDSTNIYTSKKLSQFGMNEWTVVTTDFQSSGRGQRGKEWESEAGANLLMSVLVKPRHIQIDEQFVISAAISVSILGFLSELGIAAHVKWPNDILVNGRKICGVLIQNQWSGKQCETSIVGVGLNINQLGFKEYEWPATSIAQELGENLSVERARDEIIKRFQGVLQQSENSYSGLLEFYNQHLFRLGSEVEFIQNGETEVGELLAVRADGAINLKIRGEVKTFVNGEIKLKKSGIV